MAKIDRPEVCRITTAPGRERIEIGIEEYRGREFLNVRKFYFDEKSGEYKPTPKGITIPIEKSAKVLKKLRRFAEYCESKAVEDSAEDVAKAKKKRVVEPDDKPAKVKAKKRPPREEPEEDVEDSKEMRAFKKKIGKDGTVPMKTFLTEIDEEDRPDPPKKRRLDFGDDERAAAKSKDKPVKKVGKKKSKK